MHSVKKQNRLTIYLGEKERQKLLEWAKDFTHARSASEAIFSALTLLKAQKVVSRKKEALKALDRVQGKWANNRKIDEALASLEKGWSDWNNRAS